MSLAKSCHASFPHLESGSREYSQLGRLSAAVSSVYGAASPNLKFNQNHSRICSNERIRIIVGKKDMFLLV